MNSLDSLLKNFADNLETRLREAVREEVSALLKKEKAGEKAIDSKVYLSVKDVARLLNYKSTQTIYQKVYRSEMPAPLPGKRLLFKKNEIEKWIHAGCPSDWEAVLLEEKAEKFLAKKSPAGRRRGGH